MLCQHRSHTRWVYSSLRDLQRQGPRNRIRTAVVEWKSLDAPQISRVSRPHASYTNWPHGAGDRRDIYGVVEGEDVLRSSVSYIRGLRQQSPIWSVVSPTVVDKSTFAASPMMGLDRPYVSASLPLLDRGKSDGVGQVVPGPLFVKLSLGDSRDIPPQIIDVPSDLQFAGQLIQYLIKECEWTKRALEGIDPTRLVLCSPTEEEVKRNLRGVVTRDTVGLEDTFIDPTTPLSDIPDRIVVVDTEAEPSKSYLESGMLTPLAELQPEPLLGPGFRIPFTAPVNWMSETLELIKQGSEKVDGLDRVAPLALVRCSRGGKTRALKEVAAALTADGYNAMYISLNDYTSLTDSDREDPVGALCLRMAFAAWKERSPEDISFDKFDKFSDTFLVNPKTVTAWLGDTPCVLLIDELNNLPQSSVLSEFLKKNFVAKKGRYLVFSSHVIGATSELSSYMDTNSSRAVEIQRLPLIPTLDAARLQLKQDLTARQILFYGLVPGLIVDEKLSPGNAGGQKRDWAVRQCIEQNLANDESMRMLLRSFITGDREEIMEPLHAFMDTYVVDGQSKPVLQWIPLHMTGILSILSTCQKISADLRNIVREIPRLFSSFQAGKTEGGEGWEALFIIALICRCVSGEFERGILPLTGGPYPVTFNSPLRAGSIDTKCLKEFVAAIQSPNKGPHVAIYCPRHAQFEGYDVIVAFYDTELTRFLYGYQLKEGKALPTKPASVQAFEESYVIRGKPAGEDSMHKAWQTPGWKTIANFFGVSGSQWTPKHWSKLEASDSGEESSGDREDIMGRSTRSWSTSGGLGVNVCGFIILNTHFSLRPGFAVVSSFVTVLSCSTHGRRKLCSETGL